MKKSQSLKSINNVNDQEINIHDQLIILNNSFS